MILIIGANGSMGRRYQAILDYLGEPIMCADVHHSTHGIISMAGQATGVIIASPTDTHVRYTRLLMGLKKPILCEKPVTKDVDELKDLIMELKVAKTPFRMMYQYSMLADKSRIGKTYYNYYHHGNDGLIWDCMQIIALARGQCALEETSPVWRCMINGKALRRDYMDAAYIGYVQKWLREPAQDLDEILRIHEKVRNAEKKGLADA